MHTPPRSTARRRAARFPLLLSAAACAAIPVVARPAAAQENDVVVHEFDPKTGVNAAAPPPNSITYLNPGALLSLVGGRASAIGVGVEVSAMHFPSGKWNSFGWGGFTQAQLYAKHPRIAGGGQVAIGPVGAELGLAYRAGDGHYVGTTSVHGAIFLSIGVLVISLREALPLNGINGAPAGFGPEVAFTFGFKFPFLIQGHDRTMAEIFGG